MARMTRLLRMAARFGDAAARLLRALATAFILAGVVLFGPLYALLRPVDTSHGIPMPRRAGAPA